MSISSFMAARKAPSRWKCGADSTLPLREGRNLRSKFRGGVRVSALASLATPPRKFALLRSPLLTPLAIFRPSPAVAVSTLKGRVKVITCAVLKRFDQLPAAADVLANVGIEGAALARELAVLEGIAVAERRAVPAGNFWTLGQAQCGGYQDPLLHMQHPIARPSISSCSCWDASKSLFRRLSSAATALSFSSGDSSSFCGEGKREFNLAFFGAGA